MHWTYQKDEAPNMCQVGGELFLIHSGLASQKLNN